MTESVAIRGNAIDDPQTSQAFMALLQSVVADFATFKAAYNTHTHVTAGAIGTGTVPTVLVGNLNTVP